MLVATRTARAAALSCRFSPLWVVGRASLAIRLPTTDDIATERVEAGGHWSPASIERRVTRARRRPEGAEGARSSPPKAEEDFWLDAGAPGYTISDLEATRQGAGGGGDASSRSAGWTSALTADDDVFAVSRVSEAQVSYAKLPAFLQCYQRLVLPAYRRCEGFLGAQLLVGGLPPDATRAEIIRGAYMRAGSPTNLPVRSITQWRAASDLHAAGAKTDYLNAMRALAEFFSDAPNTEVMRVCAAADVRWSDSSSPTDGASQVASSASSTAASAEAAPSGDHEHVNDSALGLR